MLNIVILAAGQGKRMQSSLPKVLHPIAGRAMLSHVLDAAETLGAQGIVVVVGHGAEQVQAAYASHPGLQFALQQPQLGTGHAVLQAVPMLQEDGMEDVTIVLYGDVPLVQPETLRTLLAARGEGLAVLTEILTDPTGYGRIVRDAKGHVCAIVEHKDATEEQHPQRTGETGDQRTNRRSEQRKDDDRLAPETIAQPTQHRSEDQLGERERRREDADDKRTGPETFGILRQDRQDDAETDEVDGNRCPDDTETAGELLASLRL